MEERNTYQRSGPDFQVLVIYHRRNHWPSSSIIIVSSTHLWWYAGPCQQQCKSICAIMFQCISWCPTNKPSTSSVDSSFAQFDHLSIFLFSTTSRDYPLRLAGRGGSRINDRVRRLHKWYIITRRYSRINGQPGEDAMLKNILFVIRRQQDKTAKDNKAQQQRYLHLIWNFTLLPMTRGRPVQSVRAVVLIQDSGIRQSVGISSNSL